MSTELEFELTYLASGIPREIEGTAPLRLIDVYVPERSDLHPRLRLRMKGAIYELTKKLPVDDDPSVHTEATISLDAEEFQSLRRASTREVEKDRYKVFVGGRPAEVDVFQGDLRGLILIDFEFESAREKEAFSPPDICLADVTAEDFVAGGLLAGKSYADVAGELARFGYERLEV